MGWDREIACTAATLPYWEQESKFSDTDLGVATGTLGVSKVTLIWSRTTPGGTREDLVTTNFHLAVHNLSLAYASLTDSQKSDAEGDLDTFVTWWASAASDAFTFIGYSWHDVTAGDAKYGPADRSTTKSVVGAGSSTRLPDQLSINATWKTASRQHWGRNYLPGISRLKYENTYGRITNSACDEVAGAFRTLYNNLIANTAATEIVVYSHQHQAVLSVTELTVDNVPDVVRRRRPKMASYRKSYTA